MTEDQAKLIDHLREAAKEFGAVYDLLIAIEEGIMIDGLGNKEVVADKDNLEIILAAQEAAAFAKLDRKDQA